MARFRLLFIYLICFVSFSSSVFTVESAESSEEAYSFKGVHFIASYLDCDPEALCDVEGVRQAMLQAAQESGATILKHADHVFPPHGITMVILLSESHASIHTYPEHGACFVDLFTCGDKCSSEKFDAALRAYLKPKSLGERTLIRTEEIQDKGK